MNPVRQSYAYEVTVLDKKRHGGVVHAGSMEEAVRRVAKQCGLEVQYEHASVNPQTNCVVQPAHWYLDGKRASVKIHAPAECFPDLQGAGSTAAAR